ncbi:conserved protein of unknown function [Alteromonas macleodii]|uniref:Uncharacterized protein n=1 Tax=Alteromonas macleodii TaxID=28108 RepID=A0A6T9XYI6_ALTMA|nr:conserved protein of unknown function [Alteromonas macleodii]
MKQNKKPVRIKHRFLFASQVLTNCFRKGHINLFNISVVKRWTLIKYSANFSSALIRAAFCLRPHPGDIKSKLEQSDFKSCKRSSSTKTHQYEFN